MKNKDASRKTKLSNILHNQAKIAGLNKELEDAVREVKKELDAYKKSKRSSTDFLVLGRRKR